MYALGPFYLITNKAANLIVENSRFQNFMTVRFRSIRYHISLQSNDIQVEDALIAGIIAEGLGIQRHSLPMVFRYRFDVLLGFKKSFNCKKHI